MRPFLTEIGNANTTCRFLGSIYHSEHKRLDFLPLFRNSEQITVGALAIKEVIHVGGFFESVSSLHLPYDRTGESLIDLR